MLPTKRTLASCLYLATVNVMDIHDTIIIETTYSYVSSSIIYGHTYMQQKVMSQ